MRWDPDVWEHSGVAQATRVPDLQRSAVRSPSEIGFKLKHFVFIGPSHKRELGEGTSGIFEDSNTSTEEPAGKEPFKC